MSYLLRRQRDPVEFNLTLLAALDVLVLLCDPLIVGIAEVGVGLEPHVVHIALPTLTNHADRDLDVKLAHELKR